MNLPESIVTVLEDLIKVISVSCLLNTFRKIVQASVILVQKIALSKNLLSLIFNSLTYEASVKWNVLSVKLSNSNNQFQFQTFTFILVSAHGYLFDNSFYAYM